jgi:hypothetical protein
MAGNPIAPGELREEVLPHQNTVYVSISDYSFRPSSEPYLELLPYSIYGTEGPGVRASLSV